MKISNMPITNTPFLEPVLDILPIGPKEQVSRLDALQDVTGVTNLFPFWYRAMMKHPRNAMCFFFFVSSQVHYAVGIPSLTMKTTNPEPAAPCLVDKFPEPMAEFNTFLWDGLIALLATILPGRTIGESKLATAF